MRSQIGGLAADLSADFDASGSPPLHAVRISGKLWLGLPEDASLYWRDLAWLMCGLSLHSDSLYALHPDGLTVMVKEFSFPVSDYVPEVAAFAMEGWVRETFDLAPAGIGVEFDAGRSRYVFSWNTRMPFTDEESGIPTRHE